MVAELCLCVLFVMYCVVLAEVCFVCALCNVLVRSLCDLLCGAVWFGLFVCVPFSMCLCVVCDVLCGVVSFVDFCVYSCLRVLNVYVCFDCDLMCGVVCFGLLRVVCLCMCCFCSMCLCGLFVGYCVMLYDLVLCVICCVMLSGLLWSIFGVFACGRVCV